MGEYTWPNGDVYRGHFENGRPHGKGVKTYTVDQAVVDKLKEQDPDFDATESYDGDWVGGAKQGEGKYRYADGKFYEG
jgi:hypothetical protein